MLTMLQDLVHHKGFADAALLNAISQHEDAAQEPELRRLLHHSLLANRFWLTLIRNLPFDLEDEMKIPESLGELAAKGVHVFALIVQPLKLQGGTGSTVAPIAIR